MVLQVLAVESQSYIDYAMPVRCMGYDAAECRRQLKERKTGTQTADELRNQAEKSSCQHG
ncbi:MAG: hypothetical protein V8S42_04840 [Lachnospiraceae bacterium]